VEVYILHVINVFAAEGDLGLPNISTVDSSMLVSDILGMMTQFSLIGGALWAIWGVMVLAGGLKDKNGPALQAGIWQIVGGALILIASVLFQGVVKIE
jgi:hypothetical protein